MHKNIEWKRSLKFKYEVISKLFTKQLMLIETGADIFCSKL